VLFSFPPRSEAEGVAKVDDDDDEGISRPVVKRVRAEDVVESSINCTKVKRGGKEREMKTRKLKPINKSN